MYCAHYDTAGQATEAESETVKVNMPESRHALKRQKLTSVKEIRGRTININIG